MITLGIFKILLKDKTPKARKRLNLKGHHENRCSNRHIGVLQTSSSSSSNNIHNNNNNNNNNNFPSKEWVAVEDFRANEVAEVMEAVSGDPGALMLEPGHQGAAAEVEEGVRGSIMGRIMD